MVLFLLAPSPGQVLRLLERRQRGGKLPAGEYRLSTPLPPQGWRVLLPPASGQTNDLALLLSTALTHPVTILQRETASEWSATVYLAGQITEEVTGSLLPAPRSLWNRLPGARAILSPDAAWAESRSLPINAVPFWNSRARRIPVIDYVTVAQLDQRHLLTEDTRRFYRFTLAALPDGTI